MRLIDADALKEKLDELEPYIDCDENSTTWILSDEVYNAIDNATTVKAFTKEDMAGAYNEGYVCGSRENKRPQGKWLFDKENSFTIDMFKCSICGYFGHTHFKFCPNCGADMRGVE